MYYDVIDSPVGIVYVVFTGDVLKGVTLERPPCRNYPINSRIKNQFYEYFAGNRKSFDVGLYLDEITPFCAAVYETLNRVSYGDVCTYKELAQWVGIVGGARAVGQALRKNPLPVVIPCHRVIASNGSLGGFSLGLHIKRWLLEREKVSISLFTSYLVD
ncbi:MAG: methylated-DNA--[protein]-cysteine S-methyltransferase [Candidatus Magnetobacterium sp. LHC-1]